MLFISSLNYSRPWSKSKRNILSLWNYIHYISVSWECRLTCLKIFVVFLSLFSRLPSNRPRMPSYKSGANIQNYLPNSLDVTQPVELELTWRHMNFSRACSRNFLLLKNPQFHNYFYKMSRLDPIINQLNAFHNFTHCFSNTSYISSSWQGPCPPNEFHWSEERNPYN